MYSEYLHKTLDVYEAGPAFKTKIPALGITAYVAPRTERAPIQGGPGDRTEASSASPLRRRCPGRLLSKKASSNKRAPT